MVCGTTSDAGKSTLVVGLCRLLARRGISVAPFKGQNMSLNSVVTTEGAEIGRAQWIQAIAARAEPEAAMNPVLLKPTTERSSQVILMGRPVSTQNAAPYQRNKAAILPVVDHALADLRSRFDVVICEGAGSPAEINLLENDIVNLGLAQRAGIPAILVGDIHRGGVFAHLYGTVAVLPDDLRPLIKAFIINMFRGDPALLGDGMDQLEAKCGVPTLGVMPYLPGLVLDAEDSLHRTLAALTNEPDHRSEQLDVAVIRLPRLSNFTDFDPLLVEHGVAVRFVEHPSALGDPDLIVLPGTKSTVADLAWLRFTGLLEAIEVRRRSANPPVVLGICGGFQMLGERIVDPDGVESDVVDTSALGWLPLQTVFHSDKTTRLRSGMDAAGHEISGYEIRHGRTVPETAWQQWLLIDDSDPDEVESGQSGDGLVFGTSLHGLFESDEFRSAFLDQVAQVRRQAWRPAGSSFAAARERQIDAVADACEAHLDLNALWRLIETGTLAHS
jgi:adenosylcobyric acid synthase